MQTGGDIKVVQSHNNKGSINEQIVLVDIIGLLTCVQEGVITIDEAEVYMFSPYTVNKLKKYRVCDEIVNLIECGCELEDIRDLLPQELDKTISELKNRAIGYIKATNQNERWIK